MYFKTVIFRHGFFFLGLHNVPIHAAARQARNKLVLFILEVLPLCFGRRSRFKDRWGKLQVMHGLFMQPPTLKAL
jgi:elongation factor P hydroxylase